MSDLQEGQVSGLILIVDDELLQRLPMRETLEQSCFRVMEAKDGADAWDLVQRECPDLVISDVVMPGMDGFAFCERVRRREEFKHLPIVMATSLEDEASIERAYRYGATDFITKPINWNLLGHRVRYILRSARTAQNLADRESELLQTRIEIIRRLGQAAEYRDNETGFHIQRMSYYAALMGEGMGFSTQKQELLLHAAPMHDVGKIGIPDRILLKPGKLTAEEFSIMKTHTTLGAKLLDQEPSLLLRTAHTIALTHHERWDGAGYPNGLAQGDIPLMGRICSLADVFDALTSRRPYKLPWSVEAAVDEIDRNSGSMFDPAVVHVFHAVMPEVLKIKEAFSDPV
ncbi:MAG: response regulator [Magnetococcales bacterium]|nr:response regulator [Magnetococcales bacterium]MBF0151985.1 response regulator [Magnetococcales bacterium]MBF0172263.1 response regulator [Magnetococcales bacterium]MBF0629965.1 response regulator [Magnetococcales bacterium]